ncbi:MAG: FeoA family protein [Verrucomicrobiota bacterium]|jgi:Fe2+ transport system protein FeoA
MKSFAQLTQCDDRDLAESASHCRMPFTCPLNRVEAGVAVRIKELSAPPNVTQRLREIGFGEQQVIRLLVRQSNIICLVCNTRLALSFKLAQMIIVEPLTI